MLGLLEEEVLVLVLVVVVAAVVVVMVMVQGVSRADGHRGRDDRVRIRVEETE